MPTAGIFPAHHFPSPLASTPSSGVSETLRALHSLGQARRTGATAYQVAKKLSPRANATAVAAILDGISSTLVTKTGNLYRLTLAGNATARHIKPCPVFPYTY